MMLELVAGRISYHSLLQLSKICEESSIRKKK